MTFIELMKLFPTEESVIDYYIKFRYPDGVRCNHCGSPKVYQETKRRKVFSCNDCLSTFSPFKGTIFEKSSTDLRKWMYGIHLFLNGKKRISGLQLQKEIGVTYKTAWRMLQQIRMAMGNAEHKEFIDTVIEIDETYVGWLNYYGKFGRKEISRAIESVNSHLCNWRKYKRYKYKPCQVGNLLRKIALEKHDLFAHWNRLDNRSRMLKYLKLQLCKSLKSI